MVFQLLTFRNRILCTTVYQENSGLLSLRSLPVSGLSLSPISFSCLFPKKKIGKSPTRLSVESTAPERPMSETVFFVQRGGPLIFREFFDNDCPVNALFMRVCSVFAFALFRRLAHNAALGAYRIACTWLSHVRLPGAVVV